MRVCSALLQAASDVYSPVSGEVLESNQALADEPAKVKTPASWCFCFLTDNYCSLRDRSGRRFASSPSYKLK